MTFIYYDPDYDYEYGPDLSDLVEYLLKGPQLMPTWRRSTVTDPTG